MTLFTRNNILGAVTTVFATWGAVSAHACGPNTRCISLPTNSGTIYEASNAGVKFDTRRITVGNAIISPMRTVRLPLDPRANGKPWDLPAGIEPFAIRNSSSLRNGSAALKAGTDVVIPAYGNEAAYFGFSTVGGRPVLIKMYVGGVNTITGKVTDKPNLTIDPAHQDYFVIGGNANSSSQPWSDGIRVNQDTVRQFIFTADAKQSVEAQVRGQSVVGGMQIIAIPMNEAYYRDVYAPKFAVSANRGLHTRGMSADMEIGAGAEIEQKVYSDAITGKSDPAKIWDISRATVAQIQFVPAALWPALTGEKMPTAPLTPAQYANAGIPFFKLPDADEKAVAGASPLSNVKPSAPASLDDAPVVVLPPKPASKPWSAKPN